MTLELEKTGLLNQFNLLFVIIGNGMDEVQSKKKEAKKKGITIRIIVIGLTMLVTISSGIIWPTQLKYLSLILATILTAVSSIEGLFMYLDNHQNLDNHLIELTVLYTDMALCLEGGNVNQSNYDSYKIRLEEINAKFHKNRVNPNLNDTPK